jgi:hypothetical protein
VHGDGKMMPTVVARRADDEEVARQNLAEKTENMSVLKLLAENPALSLRDIARDLLWTNKSGGTLDQKKVSRVITRLKKLKLVDETNQLTELGQKIIEEDRKPMKTVLSFANGNGAAASRH